MPALPPPTAIVTVNVSQIAPATWDFESDTPGLVTPGGVLDFTVPGFKGVSPVYIKFQIAPAAGYTAEYMPSPPSMTIWNQKTTGTECSSADKNVPDQSQGAKITFIDAHDIQLKYGNHTGLNGKTKLKCNFYSMSMNVGNASTPPTVQTLDPIITNGDGNVCVDSQGHPIACLTRRSRHHRKHTA